MRDGAIEVVLGDWSPKRVAVLQFDSVEQIHTFPNSPEHTTLKDIRAKSSNINMIVVDGL